eukprot:jgi/Undpi1/11328/HiC_scaffold_30.g13626.m1
MDTSESMSIVDAEEAGAAAPFTAQGLVAASLHHEEQQWKVGLQVSMGGAKAVHRDHICSIKFVIELDPDMSVGKMTYVFIMDELLSTQKVLVETVGLVEGFKKTPVMRTVPHTIAPIPLHADLIYTSDVAPTPEKVPASSAAGTVECAACKMEVVVRELRQRVGGHIRETKEEDDDDKGDEEEEGDDKEDEESDEEEDGEDEEEEDEEGVDEEEEDEQIEDKEEEEQDNIEAEEKDKEEEREGGNNEDRRGVDGVGNKACERGGRGVGAATPYAVSRSWRRYTSKGQWSQLG